MGRECSNDVVIADKSVSRRHAIVTPVGMKLNVRDLDSSLGTLIDGVQTAAGTAALGDEIRFGQARLFVAARPPGGSAEGHDGGAG